MRQYLVAKRIGYIFFSLSLFSTVLFLMSAGIPGISSFPHDIGKLKGKVRFLFVYSYNVDKDSLGNLSEILTDKSFVDFHEAGSVIITDKIRNNRSIEEYFCNYDSHGNLIEKMVSEVNQNDNLQRFHYIYKYDSQDRGIETVEITENGIVPLKHEMRAIKKTFWQDVPLDSQRTTYSYLRDSEKVIRHSYASNGSLKKIDTTDYYKLDDDFSNFYYPRNITHKEKEVQVGKDSKIVNQYNEQMDIIESDYYKPADSLVQRRHIAYNINGHVSSDDIFKGDKLIYKTTHSYIYDNIGNWTTDSVFDQGTLSHIMIRKYEYY